MISSSRWSFILVLICRDMDQDQDAITLPVRVIRSFPHRNIRNLVLKNISTSITTETLLETLLAEVNSNSSLPPPFR